MNDLAECVNNGAELLDRYVPNWYKYIDVDRLNLAKYSCCIIGQLDIRDSVYTRITERRFTEKISALSGKAGVVISPDKYGFDVPEYMKGCQAAFEEYAKLTEEWYRAIHERRIKCEKVDRVKV